MLILVEVAIALWYLEANCYVYRTCRTCSDLFNVFDFSSCQTIGKNVDACKLKALVLGVCVDVFEHGTHIVSINMEF